jgi:hypothetical protein
MDEYDDDEYTHNESFGELEEAENFAVILMFALSVLFRGGV